MHIFPPIGKKNAYISPIDLKFTKLQKKAENFHAPPHYNKFHLGKKYKSRMGGGGQKYKLKI